MELDKSLAGGSVSMLVLKLLEDGDKYGYQMIEELRRHLEDQRDAFAMEGREDAERLAAGMLAMWLTPEIKYASYYTRYVVLLYPVVYALWLYSCRGSAWRHFRQHRTIAASALHGSFAPQLRCDFLK